MATAEFAVAMPALLLVLGLALSALALGVDQVRCVDAARAGARLMARGESAGVVLQAVRRAAPDRARVVTVIEGRRVVVRVEGRARGPLGWSGLSWSPTATAVAEREDGLEDDLEDASAPAPP